MEHLFPQLAQLFNDTLSSGDDAVISSATEALERLSVLPEFPFSLVSIATGRIPQCSMSGNQLGCTYALVDFNILFTAFRLSIKILTRTSDLNEILIINGFLDVAFV
ncbi:hypothetical protein NE237_015165 [Protea cynaroides]|uniref:Uncharacterized protein n=1 Tax=Protea cynaroides TaxID=273540 RepID=A0A9Q0KDI9_9MAGN|nr:hypothetical protein NE237_015165 [Protea cynaroides]